MTITRSSLDLIPTSFATVSIGTPNDPLPDKLKAISQAGFQAIELGFPDLVSFASTYHNKQIKENDYDSLCSAGDQVKKLCERNKLGIMMLQPFSNFEGWPEGSKERENAFDRAKGWIRIMQAVGTDMLQVGSSDSPNMDSTPASLAHDLILLADLLAPHSFRLAYENWCWATHAPDWSSVYNIVKLADRPNIGLCLDTFQTAGSEWADPTTSSGLIEPSGPDKTSTKINNQKRLMEDFEISLRSLTETIPKEKIYLLQISDAYKPATPLSKENDENGLRPRGQWSMNFRPFPFNGGYLPVVEVAKAVLGTGTRCWFSYEVFDGGPEGKKERNYKMGEFAKRGMESHKMLLDKCAD